MVQKVCIKGVRQHADGCRKYRKMKKKVHEERWERKERKKGNPVPSMLALKHEQARQLGKSGSMALSTIVWSGLESSSAYQLTDRQRAALFSTADTSCRPNGCQVPYDPTIPCR